MQKLLENVERLADIEARYCVWHEAKPQEPNVLEMILDLIAEASSLANDIKLDLAEYDPVTLEIQNHNIRITLKKLIEGKLKSVNAYEVALRFFAEKSQDSASDFAPPDFIFDNWSKLFEIFHSQVDIYTYLYNKLKIGPLITTASLPSTLKNHFSELREAYAHGLYGACVALCRIILEVCLKDSLSKIENYKNASDILKRGRDKRDFEFSLFENINIAYSLNLISKDLKVKADKIRGLGNKVVHTKEDNSIQGDLNSYEILKDTIEVIESLYR